MSLRPYLRTMFHKLPEDAKPRIRRAYAYSQLRSRALAQSRRIYRGHRVEFLDYEIANLEPFEFLGPGAKELLVETRRTLVSPGTERAVLCGLPGAPRGIFPFPPGYSAVGVVSRLGVGLDGFRVGQRVAGRLPHASRGNMSQISLFPVPDDVSDEEASFIELGIITCQGIRRAHIAPGNRVAVLGQGLIGQLSNRLARLCGASWIAAIASSRNRAATSLRGGWVDVFVALNEIPRLEDIRADVVIEAVGTPGAVLTAMSCAREGGTVVLLGSARGLGRNVDLHTAAQKRRLALVGAHISVLPGRDSSPGRFTYEEEGRIFLDLLRTRRLSVADLITWHAQPGECNAVYEILAKGGDHHTGIQFVWS